MGRWIDIARGLCVLAACLAIWTLAGTEAAYAQDADVRGAVQAPAPGTVRIARTPSNRGLWDITVEGGLSLFEDPDGILGEPLPAGVTPFDFSENSFDAALGVRLTIGYRTGNGTRWEARGSWLGNWDASSRQTGQFGFRNGAGGPLLLSPTASTTLANESEVWSGELNWWKTCSCDPCSQLDWGLGGRVIGIDDELTATNWAGLAPDSALASTVENRFLGVQAMVAWKQRPSTSFSWAISGKLLAGWMNRDMVESDTSIVTGGATTNGAREETDFTWGFELEVSALWRVMSRVGITASYTLLYLDEISRVENALDFAQAATGSLQMQDAGDSALIHSFFVGVRIDI